MVRVEITNSLFQEIEKKFKRNSSKIFDLIETLEHNPLKGKILGSVGGVVIKELRYSSFRFYFIVNGHQLRCFQEDELVDLLLRFVRLSDKDTQQKVISEIKQVLINIGPTGFT
ncbi:hypothetical protein JXM83_04555 [Candidatus Woesearchaeota archaeon]|nr:hypothetical protein [Candidatus Woesearchaeota archaeon]